MDIEEILKKANEKVKDPDVIVDPYDLSYVWVSEKFCRITGYSKAELAGKQIIDVSARKKDDVKRIEMEIMGSNSGKPMSVPLRTKGGKRIEFKGAAYHIDFRGQPYVVAKLMG
jgi:PAS domain S-box-containing protein